MSHFKNALMAPLSWCLPAAPEEIGRLALPVRQDEELSQLRRAPRRDSMVAHRGSLTGMPLEAPPRVVHARAPTQRIPATHVDRFTRQPRPAQAVSGFAASPPGKPQWKMAGDRLKGDWRFTLMRSMLRPPGCTQPDGSKLEQGQVLYKALRAELYDRMATQPDGNAAVELRYVIQKTWLHKLRLRQVGRPGGLAEHQGRGLARLGLTPDAAPEDVFLLDPSNPFAPASSPERLWNIYQQLRRAFSGVPEAIDVLDDCYQHVVAERSPLGRWR